jgi:hypothetical protein
LCDDFDVSPFLWVLGRVYLAGTQIVVNDPSFGWLTIVKPPFCGSKTSKQG